MKVKLIIFGFQSLLLFSVPSLFGQNNIIYYIPDYINSDGDTCFCLIIKNEIVNCFGKDNIKNGKWVNYKQGTSWHTDFTPSGNYEYYDSYSSITSEGEYLNNKKIGNWIYYSLDNYRTKQYIEKITHYKKGLKDSTELFFYADINYLTKVFWNNSKRDSLKIFHNDILILIATFNNDNDFDGFRFFENERLKYIWKSESNDSENFIFEINSNGIKFNTNKKWIDEVIPHEYFNLFIIVY